MCIMLDREFLLNELRNKSKVQIGIENNMSRHQIYRLEKKLKIKKEDYSMIYHNKEKLQKLIDKYGTSSEVGRQLGVSNTTINKYCNLYEITVEQKRNHMLCETYFDKIDNEHKAYWLGYLMADGSMNKECTKITLNISVIDEEKLRQLKEDVNSSVSIKYSTNNNFDYCRLMLSSKKMCRSLIYHGIVPKKSGKEILPDTVPKNLKRHFIRGYLDGDGSIVIYCNGPSSIKLDFAGMSYNIFYSIHDFLLSENVIDSSILIKKEKNSRCMHLNYYSSNAIKVLDYLYKDSTIYLERKYLKYLEKSSALQKCKGNNLSNSVKIQNG